MQTILKFKGKWRDYQSRVLDELSFHIADKKLNIVAAPGAGKTTLGIEVIARLNAPALIFAPTLTIRNQWIERITKAFLEVSPHDIISTNIRNPKQITVITYQALLAAFCKADGQKEIEPVEEEEEISEKNLFARFNKTEADKIIGILKQNKTDILCFDEAHHLRNEWWKALDYLTENLEVNHTVSLTATPPYDVSPSEWRRYENLCGPVDALISIPELVKNGDLCPHQDFIYFSTLRSNESQSLDLFKNKIISFFREFNDDAGFAGKLLETDFFAQPEKCIAGIFDDPEFFISMAAFIKVKNFEIPNQFLSLFGVKYKDIPEFTVDWAQKFLNGLVFTNRSLFKALEEDILKIELSAKRHGIVSNKKICIKNHPRVTKELANSLSKLDSVAAIVREEKESLGKNLRMVILADYIRADSFGKDIVSLGVVPIFETLRKTPDLNLNLGILSGKIVIIPKSIKDDFINLVKEHRLDEKIFSLRDLECDENYLKIIPSINTKNFIVTLITALFCDGKINILTGTQALLGEGWDAPSINSLVLSSTVSSYMLSNQMRGRAIRTDKNNPGKVANIWHLASVKKLDFAGMLKALAPGSNMEDGTKYAADFSHDFYKVSKRFECFEGPSYKKPLVIESGIERCAIKPEKILDEQIAEPNNTALTLACDRINTANAWKEALYGGNSLTGIKQGLEIFDKQERKNTLLFNATMKYSLLFYAFIAFLLFSQISSFGLYAAIISAAAFIALAAKPVYKFILSGSIEGTLKQTARCVLESMYASDLIKSNLQTVGLSVKELSPGEYFFSISNVTTEENNQFLKAVQEILDPVENPRYIVERHGLLLERFRTKDYHAVPEIFGRKKESAELFAKFWNKYISKCNLIYTRTAEGRRTLLKARKKAFSALFRKNKIKRLSRWA